MIEEGRRRSQADWTRKKMFAVMRAMANLSLRGSEVMVVFGGRTRERRSRCEKLNKNKRRKRREEV